MKNARILFILKVIKFVYWNAQKIQPLRKGEKYAQNVQAFRQKNI